VTELSTSSRSSTGLRIAQMAGATVADPNRLGFSAPPKYELEERPKLRGIGGISAYLLCAIMAALVVWGAVVPLEGAVIGSGRVVVESNSKTIQSRDGGKVEKIYVRDGDTVEAGDVLLRFDRVQAQVSYDLHDGQVLRQLARKSRLIAEAKGETSIVWADELIARSDDPEVANLIAIEQSLFDSRNDEFRNRADIASSRIQELSQQEASFRDQLSATERQRHLIEEEAGDVAGLVRDGLARKPRLLALQRGMEELTARESSLLGSISTAHEQRATADLELATIDYERKSSVVNELTQVEAALAESAEHRRSAKDKIENSTITAVESGKIVNLRFFGEGAIVNAAEPIMDIVPQGDELVVVAQIRPTDIDSVHENQAAEVRVTAYSFRDVFPLKGETTNVSADLIRPEGSETEYYEVRVRVFPEEFKKNPEMVLYPGMPADVIIKTGDRTMFEYLMKPISRAIYLSFRE
jgi:HlyD family secretion protein